MVPMPEPTAIPEFFACVFGIGYIILAQKAQDSQRLQLNNCSHHFAPQSLPPMLQEAVWCGFFCALSALGQSIHISSGSGLHGDIAMLELSLEAPSGQNDSGFEVGYDFPAQLLEAAGGGPKASQAAIDSGKSLTCNLRQPYTYTCILAGGRRPIR